MTQARPAVSPTVAGWTLFLLFLANVLNVGDRMLLGVVTEPVRKDLALSDTQMALANGLLFVLFNLIAGLFIARLVDRGNRVRILVLGIAGWSLATAATGLAENFTMLAIARLGVGAGEATAFPAVMSLIPPVIPAAWRPANSSRRSATASDVYSSRTKSQYRRIASAELM